MHELFEIIATLHRKMAELKPMLRRVASDPEGEQLRKMACEIEDHIAAMERRAADALCAADDR